MAKDRDRDFVYLLGILSAVFIIASVVWLTLT